MLVMDQEVTGAYAGPSRIAGSCGEQLAQVGMSGSQEITAAILDDGGIRLLRPAQRHPPRPGMTAQESSGLRGPAVKLTAHPGTARRGTRIIPATTWLLSLLALDLTRIRRVSHAGDLLADPAAAVLAGLAVLPKKSALA